MARLGLCCGRNRYGGSTLHGPAESYRSNTLILIENQKIPEDYVKGIGGASVEQRLTMIQQQVMSRTILSQILDEYGTSMKRQVEREGIESAIETLRKMIKVNP